jgi:hypothetical protein
MVFPLPPLLGGGIKGQQGEFKRVKKRHSLYRAGGREEKLLLKGGGAKSQAPEI